MDEAQAVTLFAQLIAECLRAVYGNLSNESNVGLVS